MLCAFLHHGNVINFPTNKGRVLVCVCEINAEIILFVRSNKTKGICLGKRREKERVLSDAVASKCLVIMVGTIDK